MILTGLPTKTHYPCCSLLWLNSASLAAVKLEFSLPAAAVHQIAFKYSRYVTKTFTLSDAVVCNVTVSFLWVLWLPAPSHTCILA